MRIASLKFRNFRSYKLTELNLPPVTIIRGANHSGKSTLVQGIEIGMAGRSEATDERGAGASSLIRTGESQADIEIGISDPENGARFIDCMLSMDQGRRLRVRNPADLTSTGEEFAYWLKTQSDTFSCLIDTRHFINKSPAEQKDILASIVLPAEHAWPDHRKAQAAEVGLSVNWQMPPVQVIAAGYKSAYETRTGVNRAVKQFQMPSGSIAEAGDETEIRSKLDIRKNELKDLRTKASAEDSEVVLHAEKLRSADQRISSAQSRLSAEQQELENNNAKVLSKPNAKELEKQVKRGTEAKKLNEDIATWTAERAVAKRDHDALCNLEKAGDCPTCSQAIPADMVLRLATPLNDELTRLGDAIKTANDTLKEIGDWEGAQRKLDAHNFAAEEKVKLERRVAAAHDEIAAARTQKEGLEGNVPTRDVSLQDAITQKAEAVEKGERILQTRISANSLKVAMTEAETQQAKLLKHQAILEELVEYFGTGENSAMTALLAEHIQPFQDSMNAVLINWGYQCKLNFEPFVFGVIRGSKTYSLHLLAESEKYMFAIAFQVALARTSGLLFVIVDATDIFLAPARKAMMLGLLGAGLDQVIVLASDDRTNTYTIEGMELGFFMLTCQDENDVPTTAVQQLDVLGE